MSKAIVLDTETTGFDPRTGDRIVSLAMIEIVDRRLTGRYFYKFVNPERDSSPGALKVHGLTTEFLSDKPKFVEIVEEVMAFVAGVPVIIAHNAEFDRRFMDSELAELAWPAGDWVCTKLKAQERFGRGGNRLDDLVKRFGIRDLRAETGHHGALIDALLLAAVLGPLYGEPSMVDFESDIVRNLLNESFRPQNGGGAAQTPEPPASVGVEAGARCSGAGQGLSGYAGLHHAPASGSTGSAGPAQGAADADRQNGGLT